MFRRISLVAAVAVLAAFAIRPTTGHAQDGARREPPPPPAAPTGVVTKAPVLLQAVAPEYPPAALEAGKQAKVPVRIHIDETGMVTKVEVITPVGDGFDEAAVAAAEQYVFDPAEIDGQPAAIVVETEIHFTIEVKEEPEEEPEEQPGTGTGTGTGSDAVMWENEEPGHAGDPRKPVTIEGVVVERGTRSKLAGVIVSVVQLGLDAVSDESGRFYFHGVPAGDYDILAVDDRYDRLERRVNLGKKESIDVRLWMNPTGGNPYETLVEGEREQLEVTRRTLQRRQLTTVPGTFGDPIRVIQSLPGMARTPFSLGLLLIRGSNPDDAGVYIDGHRVPLLFHFLGGPSILNAELVESIDLYPSGFPARFGRVHGGVVSIESRPSTSDGIHGSADVDLLDAGGYVRAPIGKRASLAIAGRRSYVDAFLGYVLPEPRPGATRIVVPIYWDMQARLDLDLQSEGRASVFAMTSSDRLDVLTKDPDDEVDLGLNTAIDFWRVIGTYQRPLSGKLKLTMSPAWGLDTVSFASGQSEGQSPFLSLEIEQTTLSYRARVTGPIGERFRLDAGLDLESRVTKYDAVAPDDSGIRDDDGVDIPPQVVARSVESLGAAFHADLAIDLGPVRVVPGLRLDSYLIAGKSLSSADPRITARWQTDPMWTLKGFVGRFSQPPQPEALDSTFGNPNVEIEHAMHYGAGVEWRPSRLWSADAEAYYIDRNNLIGLTDQVVVDDDGAVRPINFINTGFGRTYGLEIMIKREISERLFGWLAYTFSRTKTALPNRALRIGGLDQTHVANAVASWRVGGGWELGARWRASSGRPDTPVEDSTFDADEGNYESVSGEFRSIRLPFFQQLDVRVERMWLFNTWSLGVYVDVQNVLNTDNVEATEYDYRFRETAPVTGVPILPTLGIRGQW